MRPHCPSGPGAALLVYTLDLQAVSVWSMLQGSFHPASMRSVYTLPPSVTEALQGHTPGGKQRQLVRHSLGFHRDPTGCPQTIPLPTWCQHSWSEHPCAVKG